MNRDAAKHFREQALQIIQDSIEDGQVQHPLDMADIFAYDRPTLKDTVPLKLYRSVRLLAFKEVLGSKMSAAILAVSGRSLGQKLNVRGASDLAAALEDFGLGKISVAEGANGALTLTAEECATCSGLPNIGEPLCHFESGVISGALESAFGEPVMAVETKCWGLGDNICSWDITTASTAKDGVIFEPLSTLETVITLANKTAWAVDGAAAIRQKNRQLREAYNELAESERLKKDLTDMVVHDMRVPLTAVIGSMQTLADMSAARFSSQESELLNMALSSGQTLLQMINDLLDISKLEERKLVLRKKRTAIGKLIAHAVEQIEVLAKRRRQKLIMDVPPTIPHLWVDRDRMLRVLVNLLSNAVKHTPAGGKITVTARPEPGTGMAQISVSDTGEGIAKEFHTRIFEKFVQVDSHKSRKRMSSGLGLTFCKLITEAHGGEIWVESEPGQGSTFRFTIPLEDASSL